VIGTGGGVCGVTYGEGCPSNCAQARRRKWLTKKQCPEFREQVEQAEANDMSAAMLSTAVSDALK